MHCSIFSWKCQVNVKIYIHRTYYIVLIQSIKQKWKICVIPISFAAKNACAHAPERNRWCSEFKFCWSDTIFTWVLLYRSADVLLFSFVFYPPSLSFCRSARLFTERSLLHIMIRHASYSWLVTIFGGFSARLSFLKHFWKIAYPAFKIPAQ